MKKQIVIIHGGDAFATYDEYLSFLKNFQIDFERYRLGKDDWKQHLGKVLGESYEMIAPHMPNKNNAKYIEWKMWFEKFIPFLNSEIILIGHSMGGAFLAKYLSEEIFPKKIKATFLVAAPFNRNKDLVLVEFTLPTSLDQFKNHGGKIFLYHSIDDPVVAPTEFEKYQKALQGATCRMFTDRGHFNQDSFPELVDDIKNL
ncbi:MAG: alpha/beta hydrolase [bacterium]|nr:alpha/beta hydrolase [bacterium]